MEIGTSLPSKLDIFRCLSVFTLRHKGLYLLHCLKNHLSKLLLLSSPSCWWPEPGTSMPTLLSVLSPILFCLSPNHLFSYSFCLFLFLTAGPPSICLYIYLQVLAQALLPPPGKPLFICSQTAEKEV